MKAWFESHEEEIKTLLQSNDISGGNFFDSSNEIIHNMTIGDVYTSDSPKRFELTVKVDLEDFAQKFIYMCCQNCHRKTTAPVDTIFHCTNCKADRVAKYRYMFKIRVKDPTGELDVTLFGEHGMNIFNMKEDQFKAKYSSRTNRKLSFTNVGTSSNMTTKDENDRTNRVKTVEEKGGSKIL
ncbi:hypothetical protein OROHE_008265 [Orobanche hederae]